MKVVHTLILSSLRNNPRISRNTSLKISRSSFDLISTWTTRSEVYLSDHLSIKLFRTFANLPTRARITNTCLSRSAPSFSGDDSTILYLKILLSQLQGKMSERPEY